MTTRNGSSLVRNAYVVPGQPHILLAPELNDGWAALKSAYEAIGREIAKSDAELLLVYSTQWFSVIGHLMQVDPHPQWTLVDQNWYEFGEIPYELRIDPAFGNLYCDLVKKGGLQAATVSYHGFPIDTGTVVALSLLNPGNRIPASIVSCNIYAERDETRALGRIGRAAIEAYGKNAIVVCVTNLSNRYEVGEIDMSRDRISSSKDDEWNRKILEMLDEGRLEDVAQVAREFGREANADMGFKAIWWLAAVTGEHNRYDGKVWGYAPVWGTGCALVQLTPAPDKELHFEKEFDDSQGAALEQGTGLETHNVTDQVPRPGGPNEPSPHDSDVSPGSPSSARTASRFVVVPPFAAAERGAGIVNSERAARPVGPYPHARRVGELLFLSGIGPRNAHTNEIPAGIEAQTRAVIGNLRAVLDEAGSSLEKILDVTVYLTDMKGDFGAFNRVYGEYFTSNQPARTTVGVDSLPTPISVELKVIASA